jgi:hypothetical protein
MCRAWYAAEYLDFAGPIWPRVGARGVWPDGLRADGYGCSAFRAIQRTGPSG